MIRTYSLGCKDCRDGLWLGQSDKEHIYYDNKTHLALSAFLFDHMGHDLIFDDDLKLNHLLDNFWTTEEYLTRRTK